MPACCGRPLKMMGRELPGRSVRRHGLSDERLELVEGAADESRLLQLLVADFTVERRQKAEGDVGRLIVGGVGGGDVARQRAEGGRRREDQGRLTLREPGRVDAGDEAGRGRLEIPLDARNLSCEEQVPAAARLEGR